MPKDIKHELVIAPPRKGMSFSDNETFRFLHRPTRIGKSSPMFRFYEGLDHRNNGGRESDCPYPLATINSVHWLNGFRFRGK